MSPATLHFQCIFLLKLKYFNYLYLTKFKALQLIFWSNFNQYKYVFDKLKCILASLILFPQDILLTSLKQRKELCQNLFRKRSVHLKPNIQNERKQNAVPLLKNKDYLWNTRILQTLNLGNRLYCSKMYELLSALFSYL